VVAPVVVGRSTPFGPPISEPPTIGLGSPDAAAEPIERHPPRRPAPVPPAAEGAGPATRVRGPRR
jgi:hypothetical protein